MAEILERTQQETIAPPVSAQDILARLDAMLVELQELRQEVRTLAQAENEQPEPEQNLADKLFGSLGQGSWEELNYDIDINLYRFSDESLD